MTAAVSIAQSGLNNTTFRNRIINGAMVIDQRNAGAEVNPAVNATYYVDRWLSVSNVASKFKIGQNAGAVTPPAGFANYLGATSLSAYSAGSTDAFGLRQVVEGFNVADLAWGTANAQPITISFWVRSSLTGTFGLGLGNSGFSRSYAATYTINSTNTWEYKTVTIAGDTTGTWLTTNGIGINLTFGLGYGSSYSGTAGVWNAGSYFMPTGATSVVGTSGATFYITGVQLEKGTAATQFEYRLYGTELALCQRYYYKISTVGSVFTAFNPITSRADGSVPFPVTMRTGPTALEQSGTASDYRVIFQGSSTTCTSVPTFATANAYGAYIRYNTGAAFTVGQACLLDFNTSSAYLGFSAEL